MRVYIYDEAGKRKGTIRLAKQDFETLSEDAKRQNLELDEYLERVIDSQLKKLP